MITIRPKTLATWFTLAQLLGYFDPERSDECTAEEALGPWPLAEWYDFAKAYKLFEPEVM